MDLSEKMQKEMEKKYGYDQWCKKTIAYKGSLCKKFFLDKKSFKDFEFDYHRFLPNENRAFYHNYKHVSDEEMRFCITIHEFDTVEEAQRMVLRTRMSCAFPLVPMLEELGLNIGDVGFAGLFFSRLNIFVEMRSIGEKDVPIVEFAGNVDKQIINFQIMQNK